jgi:hypothetical protein
MNISIINPFQGLQNAYRPSGGKASSVNSGPVASSDQSIGGIFSGELEPVAGQSLGIIAGISNLQGRLDDLNVVHDPPFFPIASYQRIDIIMKISGIQEEIGKSSLPPEVKQSISADKLKIDATDKELGGAISKLFAVRDTLTMGRKVSVKNTEPGTILTMKI